jgi:adenosylcobinamide-phosphate synthase
LRSRERDALALLAGFALDRALGDPRRAHPVAGFGALEQAAFRMVELLRAGDVQSARAHAPVLVGRDPSWLDTGSIRG